jgi:Ca2+-dependent lipid-binding protein
MEELHHQLVSIVANSQLFSKPRLKIEVTVVSAQNLPNNVQAGSMDTFCTVEFCNEERKTGVRKKTLNPGTG